jgi:uncharacterized coiled-coil DUF342 family protein
MDPYEDNRAYFVLMRSEHRTVNEILRHISTMLDRWANEELTDVRSGELTEQLTQLRKDLEHHFLMEESDGCLDEAVSRCPSIGHAVDSIKAEHAGLLAQLDSLIGDAGQLSENGFEIPFYRKWEQFVAQLNQHEEAEDRLLLRGLESVETDCN